MAHFRLCSLLFLVSLLDQWALASEPNDSLRELCRELNSISNQKIEMEIKLLADPTIEKNFQHLQSELSKLKRSAKSLCVTESRAQ